MGWGFLHQQRRGAVLLTAVVALIALLALAALALDVTRLHVAAQRAQAVADSAALAGVAGLPDVSLARALALEAVAANNAQVPEWPVEVADGDAITYYAPGSTVYDMDGNPVIRLAAYGPPAATPQMELVAYHTHELPAQSVAPSTGIRVARAFAPLLALHEGFRTRHPTHAAAHDPGLDPFLRSAPLSPDGWDRAHEAGAGSRGMASGFQLCCHTPPPTPPGPTCALGVRTCVRVDYAFARVLGLHDGARTRESVAVLGPAGGICAVPIWLSEGSNPGFGQPVDLVYDDMKMRRWEIPPGSFGFLDFSTPGEDWFQQLLRGYNVSDAVRQNAIVGIGDIVRAYTGVNTGKWVAALTDETGSDDGTSRMERAGNPPWGGQSFEDHWATNPRIMLVPVVEYLSGTGNNATFRVDKFAVFWLDGAGKVAGGSNHCIHARFIEFQYSPDAFLEPGAPDSGIYARKLIL